MIICAAIKLKMNNLTGTEQIICGLRHGDCLQVFNQLNSNWLHAKIEEGFITHTGDFLNREEAFQHAKEIGQLSMVNQWFREDNKWPEELVSEDLW